MADEIKKNLRIKRAVNEEFEAWMKAVRTEGAEIKPGQLVGAALLMFLNANDATRLEWIEKARNFDIEKLRRARAAAAADQLNAAGQRAEQAREGKQSKRRSG